MADEVRIKDDNMEEVKTIKCKFNDNSTSKYKVMHCTFPKARTKRKILGRGLKPAQ